MPDPCAKCGATLRFDAVDACQACGEPIRRLSREERAAQSRGPKLAAAGTLGVFGIILAGAGLLMLQTRALRLSLALLGAGIACFGGAAAIFRDEG